jgi:predicted ferric reductase
MQKNNRGNLAIIALVVLNVVMWTVFPPVNDGRVNFERQYAGEVIGSTVLILMACALFLSTRPKWAEPYFGGLDKMYQTHRRAATSAFLLLFAHLLTVPITTVNLRLGNYLAIIAFSGVVTIVLLTLSPRIPLLSAITNASYDKWRRIHRYIGIFYTLAFIHSITINALDALIAFTYVQTIFIVGLASYLYTEVFSGFFKKTLPYTVADAQHLNGTTTEVTLAAKGTRMKHRAGQFLFVRFPGDKILDESHPFTVSSAPGEPSLRLTIKGSGDFTRYLHAHLQPGMDAIVDGGFGLFDYKTGGPRQIWIAGGIGLTPFLAFIRDMEDHLDREVDFYYVVRSRDEALFLDEIESAEKRNPKFRARIRFSNRDGSLTMEEILHRTRGDVTDREIYMCGPIGMVQFFADAFRELNVPRDHIHYEEFNFR